MKKIILIISTFITCVLIITGCTKFSEESKVIPSVEQGVFGVVKGTPYREMPSILQPGEKPREYPKVGPALDNITIQVREYFGKEEKAGKIIASTKTNEKGFYQFNLPEGTYFLVIVNADVRYAIITTGYKGKNFLEEDMINTFQIINISQGELIEQNIVVPQGWPI